MSINTHPLDPQQQGIVDALVAAGHNRDDAVNQVLALTGDVDRPSVAEAVERYLTTATENTRRTYRTHLRRLVEGVAPVCDQNCTPCADPVATVARDVDGRPRGRRLVFECRCDCGACRNSRIGFPALGEQPVSTKVLNRDNVHLLATLALRLADKTGAYENAIRVKAGKPLKQADGHGAKETAIAALRSFCKTQSKYIDGYDGHDVTKPSRSKRSRRALRDFELLELCSLVETGGNDPELDALLIELGIYTGARREGVINMVMGSLDRIAQLAHVDEKNDRTIPMPVPVDLIDKLIAHAIQRGGSRCDPSSADFDPTRPLLWMRQKAAGNLYSPLTSRRFDTLFTRLQGSTSWAASEQIGYHHLRHTMAQIIKVSYGQHVATRYLRHADQDVTGRYGRCELPGLAAALADLFGYSHPLVDGVEDRRQEVLRRFGYRTGPTLDQDADARDDA